jgi:hypothetical protein
MIKYQFFPRSRGVSNEIADVINCFEKQYSKIDSTTKNLSSDKVLEVVAPLLRELNFKVETGKSKKEKISVPVLFGLGNKVDKSFNADAVSNDGKIVLEIEAGRAVDNNQFLKDIFQACMMFEVEYLIIAVRNKYRGSDDFQKVFAFLETLYISNRLKLPLTGIVLIGY